MLLGSENSLDVINLAEGDCGLLNINLFSKSIFIIVKNMLYNLVSRIEALENNTLSFAKTKCETNIAYLHIFTPSRSPQALAFLIIVEKLST